MPLCMINIVLYTYTWPNSGRCAAHTYIHISKIIRRWTIFILFIELNRRRYWYRTSCHLIIICNLNLATDKCGGFLNKSPWTRFYWLGGTAIVHAALSGVDVMQTMWDSSFHSLGTQMVIAPHCTYNRDKQIARHVQTQAHVECTHDMAISFSSHHPLRQPLIFLRLTL